MAYQPESNLKLLSRPRSSYHNTGVILSEVGAFLRQTESKDLQFLAAIYAMNFWG